MKENDLSRCVRDYLQILDNQAKLVFLRLNSGTAYKSAGGKTWKISLQEKGTADYLVLYAGRVIWLELKGDKGSQSRDQILFQNKVESLQHEYRVIRDLDEVMEVLGEKD